MMGGPSILLRWWRFDFVKWPYIDKKFRLKIHKNFIAIDWYIWELRFWKRTGEE